LRLSLCFLLSLVFLCHPEGEKDPLKPIAEFIISDFKALPPSVRGTGDSSVVSLKLVSLIGSSPRGQEVHFSIIPQDIGIISPSADSTARRNEGSWRRCPRIDRSTWIGLGEGWMAAL